MQSFRPGQTLHQRLGLPRERQASMVGSCLSRLQHCLQGLGNLTCGLCAIGATMTGYAHSCVGRMQVCPSSFHSCSLQSAFPSVDTVLKCMVMTLFCIPYKLEQGQKHSEIGRSYQRLQEWLPRGMCACSLPGDPAGFQRWPPAQGWMDVADWH